MSRFFKRIIFRCIRHTPSQMHYRGKFRVRYPDGKESTKFDYKTAKDYKSMFGGEIIELF